MRNFVAYIVLSIFIVSCKSYSTHGSKKIELSFLDEYIIPQGLFIDSTLVGGLSGIDFDGSRYNIVCDDAQNPRYYTANIEVVNDRIASVEFLSVVKINDTTRYLDLESIRVDPTQPQLLFTSEGSAEKGKDPSVFSINEHGELSVVDLPTQFKVASRHIRNNGVFEGLSMSVDGKGYWFGMELPLINDGPEPNLTVTTSPVRISYVDLRQGKVTRQFSYMLEPVAKAPKGKFMVNGVSELLALDEHRFFIVERSYSSGLGKQGNTVRIFLANNEKATNTLEVSSLMHSSYKPATKELVLDLEEFRNKLTDHSIDNIEGICYGPTLSNGHRSLLLIADDNFNTLGMQLNQVILLEIHE